MNRADISWGEIGRQPGVLYRLVEKIFFLGSRGVPVLVPVRASPVPSVVGTKILFYGVL